MNRPARNLLPRPGFLSGPPARGSVIVLVLVTIMLAAFLLGKFVERSGTEMLADARAASQSRMRREAYSSLEVTLAVLAEFRAIDGGLYSPVQGWEHPLEYAGYTPGEGRTVDIAFEDESGKISLPNADVVKIETLLALSNVDSVAAEKAADALLVWTHSDYVASSTEADASSYETGALPHHPPQRALRSFSELSSVKFVKDLFFDQQGQPTAAYRDFVSNVSLYSFTRSNINGMSPTALAVGGLDAGQIDSLRNFGAQQQQLNAPPYFRSVNEAATVLGANSPLQNVGAEVNALRITVTVHDGASVYRLSAVIAPPGGASLAPAAPPPADQSAAAGNISAQQASTTETVPADVKKLDYPFKVLEVREDLESTPTPPPDPTAND